MIGKSQQEIETERVTKRSRKYEVWEIFQLIAQKCLNLPTSIGNYYRPLNDD